MNTLIQIQKLAKILTRHNELFIEIKNSIRDLQSQIDKIPKTQDNTNIKNLYKTLDEVCQEVYDLKKHIKKTDHTNSSKNKDIIVPHTEINSDAEDSEDSLKDKLINDTDLELELKKIDTTIAKKKRVTKKKTIEI